MFSIFPSDWENPRPKHWFTSSKKPIKNLADHHFPPRTVLISKPAPAPVPESIKAPVKIQIPESEMCIGENNDFSEVDRMLGEMNDNSQDAKTRQMVQMISTINENLEKNIKIIQNVPSYDQDTVSRDDLLRLLQMFSNFSKTLEQYFKETMPSFS